MSCISRAMRARSAAAASWACWSRSRSSPHGPVLERGQVGPPGPHVHAEHERGGDHAGQEHERAAAPRTGRRPADGREHRHPAPARRRRRARVAGGCSGGHRVEGDQQRRRRVTRTQPEQPLDEATAHEQAEDRPAGTAGAASGAHQQRQANSRSLQGGHRSTAARGAGPASSSSAAARCRCPPVADASAASARSPASPGHAGDRPVCGRAVTAPTRSRRRWSRGHHPRAQASRRRSRTTRRARARRRVDAEHPEAGPRGEQRAGSGLDGADGRPGVAGQVGLDVLVPAVRQRLADARQHSSSPNRVAIAAGGAADDASPARRRAAPTTVRYSADAERPRAARPAPTAWSRCAASQERLADEERDERGRPCSRRT